jgi:hypothetical protein
MANTPRYRRTRHFLNPIAGIDTWERRKTITSEGCGRKQSCRQLRGTISKCFRTNKNQENFCYSRQSLRRGLVRKHSEYTARVPIYSKGTNLCTPDIFHTEVECSQIPLINLGFKPETSTWSS